jgi:hypothetical protein
MKNKWHVVGFCRYYIDEKDQLYPEPPYGTMDKRDAADIDRAIVNYLADTDTYLVPDQHQSEELHCVPVVENDKGERYQVTFSLRAWGRIMGEAFGGDYMDYYCSFPEDHPGKIKLPDPELFLD